MKLSDFTLEQQNVALDGAPPRMGEWKSGSRGTMIATGTCGGKKYQIKKHSSEPKWFNTATVIAKKTAEKNASSDDETKNRLETEIQSLKNNKAKNDKADEVAEDYLKIKQNLVRALNGIGDPLIVAPADIWKQEDDSRGGGVYAVEATPWLENVAVGFDSGSPIVFNRDLDKKQQYAIIASFAERLAELHKAGIIHGDLKQGNTLITKVGSEFKVALIDFDAAILLKDLYSRKFKFDAWFYVVGGTFFAPEFVEFYNVIREYGDEDIYNDFDLNTITEKSDIFGLGITIYEYFHGCADSKNYVPFKGPDGDTLDCSEYGAAVEQADYKPDFPASMDDFMYGMLNWMLAKDPAKRPTAEQVAKAFKNEDSSLIPGEFSRNPLWEEHRDKYKIAKNPPTPGIVLRGIKPKYKVKRNGSMFNYDIDRLIEEKYVTALDGSEIEVKKDEPKVDPDVGKYWACDGSGELPGCARRASGKEGYYKMSTGGLSKIVDFNGLKAAGVICTKAEENALWPADEQEGYRYVGNKLLRRNMAFGKGPGHYILGVGFGSSFKYTSQELKDKGLLVKGVTFALWAGDTDMYEPNPEGVPDKVKAIARNALTNHQYKITYFDGKVEKLMIADMLARGYVKKK